LFETDKTFLLPSAIPGMKGLKRVADDRPDARILVSGHADRVADEAYNLQLSVERALSVAAYLRDDVGAWLACYGAGKPAARRWGTREDQWMLGALRDGAGPFYTAPVDGLKGPDTAVAVRRFQTWSNDVKGTALVVDGDCGPLTRHELVAAYMAQPGTTLPAGTPLETHGCGEWHPVVPTPDGVAHPKNRRVELFFFDGPVDPPAPASCPSPGCTAYPEWVKRSVKTIDLEKEPGDLTVLVRDHTGAPIAESDVRASGAAKAFGKTNGAGVVFFGALPAGKYLVVAEREGFDTRSTEVEVGSAGDAGSGGGGGAGPTGSGADASGAPAPKPSSKFMLNALVPVPAEDASPGGGTAAAGPGPGPGPGTTATITLPGQIEVGLFVRDGSGAPVIAAKLEVQRAGASVASVTMAPHGVAVMKLLPEDHDVTVTAPGFRTLKQKLDPWKKIDDPWLPKASPPDVKQAHTLVLRPLHERKNEFPWQSSTLLETIYPSRLLMLRRCLSAYKAVLLEGVADPPFDLAAAKKDHADLKKRQKELADEIPDLEKQLKAKPPPADPAAVAKKLAQDKAEKARLDEELKYLPDPEKTPMTDAQKGLWARRQYDVAISSEDHTALLKRLKTLFEGNEALFPGWARYMILHYSGMRYKQPPPAGQPADKGANAHGSYAPPQVLLRRLRRGQGEKNPRAYEGSFNDSDKHTSRPDPLGNVIGEIEPELAAAEKDATVWPHFAGEVHNALQQRVADLITKKAAPENAAKKKDLDAQIEKITARMKDLVGADAAKRRAVILQEHVDGAAERSAALSEDEADGLLLTRGPALAGAGATGPQGKAVIPQWAWNRMVSRTMLRLDYAKDPSWDRDWEPVNQPPSGGGAEQKQWESIIWGWRSYWGEQYWREYHKSNPEIVISRGVCDQIAEMAMHECGVLPTGGLTGTAAWYASLAKAGKAVWKRPTVEADIVPEASLFFVTWTPGDPPAGDNWSVVTRDTPEIMDEASNLIDTWDGVYDGTKWTYHLTDSAGVKVHTRTAWTKDAGSGPSKPSDGDKVERQFLRWLHQAYVVHVSTVQKRILTFETADPTGINSGAVPAPSTGSFDGSFRITSFATAAGRVGKWNTLLGVRPRAQYTADETARAEKREALRTRLLDWTKLLKGP
jgi:hypothetical protein